MDNNQIVKNNNISLGLPSDFKGPYVLTDLMDTIIERNKTIDDVFDMWARKLGKKFSLYPPFLKEYRVRTMRSAMHNTIDINVIYSEIFEQCKYYELIQGVSKEDFIKESHEIEVECEINSHSLIDSTVNFLKLSKKKGCKIICISDFRLSGDDIKSFLVNLNEPNLVDIVFSSCDIGVTKKSGELYDYVLKSLNYPSAEIIMIGDNFKSDCLNSSKRGIKAYWLKK